MMRFALVAAVAVLVAVQAIPEAEVLDETYAELVELPSLKRSEGERKYKLHAFGQEIDLDLKRTTGLLPDTLPVIVYGEDEQGTPTVDDYTHNTNSFQSLYSDKTSGASVMIEDVDGETKMHGLVGPGLAIEPIVEITIPEDDDEGTEKREVKHVRHMIYKLKQKEEDVTTDDWEMADDAEETDKSTVEKRATPQNVYADVHVVVDYALYKKLGRSTSDTIRYIKIFYNSVNEIYSTISWPYVTVSIQGITICQSASACNMVEANRLGTDGVNAKTALTAISKYAYDKRSTTGEDYALMMVMTDYDLCSPESSGNCRRSTAGLAYVGTACQKYQFSKTSKTGIAEDHGVYDGIKTVSHEMGHILGMKHDGDGPASSGAPGARNCDWNSNYIMGQTSFVENQWKWSSCSVDQLRWLVAQPKADCLLSKPGRSSYNLMNTLPGKEVSLDYQCKVLYGQSSEVSCRKPGINSGNDKLCLGLMCKTSGTGCSSSTSAAEGSYCGPQRYCIRGKCVCDPTAPAPTPLPRDPSCKGDNSRILISGKSCVNLLSSSLDSCESSVVKQYCCESRIKYCKATPISCDGRAPVTARPTPPREVYTRPTVTTDKPYVPPSSANCGKSCVDTPNMKINGQRCSSLLGSSSNKKRYCDNPTVVTHCCATRDRVCDGYHWITPSCDTSCQDNSRMSINGKKCVEFLATRTDQENYCDADITKQHCCATRRKVCSNSVFGK